MYSIKIQKMLTKLTTNYYPFTLLKDGRLKEALNLISLNELQAGETIQLLGSSERDYLFVLEGDVTMVYENNVKTINEPDITRTKPVLLPRTKFCIIVANKNSIICHAKRKTLDNLVSWSEISGLVDNDDTDFLERISIVKNSQVFRKIPIENLEYAFRVMVVKPIKDKDVVVTYGQEAHAFYILTKGTADVWQLPPNAAAPSIVAQLSVGDAFGFEALIAGSKQNERVVMTSDGSLLVLSRKDYNDLIGTQFVSSVNAKIAKTMIETDYTLLDVRCSEERHDEGYILNSENIPLHELKERIDELNRNGKYVVHCFTGRRSRIATLFLSQNKIQAVSMDGGLADWPFEIVHPAS